MSCTRKMYSSLYFFHDMKAMLFAAGMGTRLKPLTDIMPKALVPVNGRPLLAHVIERLCHYGVTEVVINVHHFASQIIDYVNTHDLGCKVKISDETEKLLDTGGGLKKASSLFFDCDPHIVSRDCSKPLANMANTQDGSLGNDDEPILVHNVDIFSNANLSEFYEHNRGNAITLMVSERQTSRYLLFNDNNELVGWTNVKTGEVRSPYDDLDISSCHRYAFSGIHLISPSVFKLMNDFPDKFPIMDFYLSICDRVIIKADVQHDLQLLDVGKQDTLRVAEAFLNKLNGQ